MKNEFRALRPDEMKDEMQSLRLLFRETYLKLQLFFLKQFKAAGTKEEKQEIKGHINDIGNSYLSVKNHVRE